MKYALEGGKRIRGVICLATAEAAGAVPEEALPAAAALELVHAFSLVHDDLPALDDDDERRGRPSTHVAFGEGIALLAGDALLIEAFRLALTYRTPDLARELVDATLGMIGGQYLDITEVDADLAELHRLKTGRLFAASVGLGLRVGGVPESEQAPWRAFGEQLGLLFQAVDDILDGDGYAARLGVQAAREIARAAAATRDRRSRVDPGRHGSARLDRRRARRSHDVRPPPRRPLRQSHCLRRRAIVPVGIAGAGNRSTSHPAVAAEEKNPAACRRPGRRSVPHREAQRSPRGEPGAGSRSVPRRGRRPRGRGRTSLRRPRPGVNQSRTAVSTSRPFASAFRRRRSMLSAAQSVARTSAPAQAAASDGSPRPHPSSRTRCPAVRGATTWRASASPEGHRSAQYGQELVRCEPALVDQRLPDRPDGARRG